jgi:hypothetical protein
MDQIFIKKPNPKCRNGEKGEMGKLAARKEIQGADDKLGQFLSQYI